MWILLISRINAFRLKIPSTEFCISKLFKMWDKASFGFSYEILDKLPINVRNQNRNSLARNVSFICFKSLELENYKPLVGTVEYEHILKRDRKLAQWRNPRNLQKLLTFCIYTAASLDDRDLIKFFCRWQKLHKNKIFHFDPIKSWKKSLRLQKYDTPRLPYRWHPKRSRRAVLSTLRNLFRKIGQIKWKSVFFFKT